MSSLRLVPWQSNETDVPRILAFLSEIAGHEKFIADFHQGDFCWQYWRGFDRSFEETIMRVETDDGSIAAIAWLDLPDELEVSTHPATFDSPSYPEAMAMLLDWAEATSARTCKPDDDPLGVTVLSTNRAMQDVLTARGYTSKDEPWLLANAQSLDYEIPVPALPEGFEIVAMTDDADFVERVETHREVWHPSKLVLEGYRKLRTSPIYDPELDLVVRAPDGHYVANVHGWYDAEARIGLLEPVGCREAYRGRGLTGALVREVLRRFQQRGATAAWVGSEPSEMPANALYRSTGFKEIDQYYQWTKPENCPPPLRLTYHVTRDRIGM